MPGANGTASAVQDDPLDLGDLIPRTVQVTITVDGKRVAHEAYMYPTAPVSVYALIAQAHDEYSAVIADDHAASLHRDQALCRYYSQVAKHLIIGMTVEQADHLGGDFSRLERLLRALEYLRVRPEPEQGEATGGGLTSGDSSPASSPFTASATATS